VTGIVPGLRFVSSSGRDRLTLNASGLVNPQQLQSMRRLTAEGADLLRRAWRSSHEDAMSSEADGKRRGALFGTPERNQLVEKAAVRFVTAWYSGHGWEVRSVERDRVGFDLHCQRQGEEHHSEVKGVSGGYLSFYLTAAEVARALADSAFRLCVVMRALTPQPEQRVFSGAELMEKFELKPVQYLAIPK
jgi:hypothetical protein